jgi:putative chitobiose transport system substrate-binding protein
MRYFPAWMKNMKRRLFASIVVLVWSLFWCQLSASAAPQKIEFWTMSMKPRFEPFFKKIIQQYETENPGVKLVWVDFPWDIIQLKLITSIAAGTPPSLVNLNVPWAEEYARDGLLEPVDALIGDKSRFTSSAVDDLSFRGKMVGFPFYSNVNVIAYNKRLFAQAGLTRAPQSLEEELEFAVRIAQKTGKPGYAATLGKIDGFFLQQGLPLIQKGHAVFNSIQHVALLQKLATAYQHNGILKDKLFSEDSFPAVLDAYQGGRLAMMISAPTALRRVQIDAPEIYVDTGIAAAPVGPSGLSDGGWMFHFGIPKGVPQQDMAAVGQFARFLTNDVNQLAFAKSAGVMPTANLALADPYFQQIPASAGAAETAMKVAAQSMKHARSLYVGDIEDYDEMRRVLVKAAEAGITGKQDIQAALDQAATYWNKKLARQSGLQAAQKGQP